MSKMIVKKIVPLILALIMPFNSFAVAVSDNDGSAFITKAEFDSLKNNFQSQIDQYNTSIDSKIDAAIAGYLAGISMTKTNNLNLDSTTNYSFPLIMMSSTDLWNNPKSTNYYNVVRNRVRYSNYQYYGFSDVGPSYAQPNVSIWTSDTDDTLHTLEGINHNALIFGFLVDQGREIKGVNAPLYNIKTTTDTIKVGSTTYKVFDMDAYGIGYQYIDYAPTYSVGAAINHGHFGSGNSNKYAYCGAFCLLNAGRGNPAANKTNWTEKQFRSSGSGHNSAEKYDSKTPSYIGTKLGLNDIPEWYGHGSGGIDLIDVEVDSSTFVWDRQSVKTMLYAGTANVPAQLSGRFGFEPDFSDGASTIVECVDIQQTGHNVGWGYNPTTTSLNAGHFLARTCTYMPPMKAIVYNGYSGTISNLPSFSALPATCIRYYDENDKVHYLDEGMFLKNFSKDGTVDFDIKFVTNSGTKSLNFYVSKEPFSRANGKTKLASFKVDNSSTTYTTKSLNTGTKYHITVEGIKNGNQLYILWEPSTAGDYVALSEFTDFTITSDN